MSEKKHDTLELLDTVNVMDETRISAAISVINKCKDELLSSIYELETEANKILNDFYSMVDKLDSVKKQFLKIQARKPYDELIIKLHQSMLYIEAILNYMDLSNNDELLADEPFENTFNRVSNEINKCKARNKSFKKTLKKLFSSNNLSKVSLIEKFAKKIILNFDSLHVYSSLQESKVAEICLYKGNINHFLENGLIDFYYTDLYFLGVNSKLFAIFTDSIAGYKIAFGNIDTEILIEISGYNYPNKCIDEFIDDIGEMLVILLNHVNVCTDSNVLVNSKYVCWVITLSLLE